MIHSEALTEETPIFETSKGNEIGLRNWEVVSSLLGLKCYSLLNKALFYCRFI